VRRASCIVLRASRFVRRASCFVFLFAPALADAAGLDWNLGADLRIRQEMMDNVPGLPGGGLVSRAERGGYKNHMRFRPRVWGELKGDAGEHGTWRLYTRLTDECRWYVKPGGDAYTWPDEVIVDNLFVEGKGLFDGFFDIAVGRQDIYNLYGLDHVFVDGTPGDGSRTVYADLVKFGFQCTEESRLDFFGIYNFDDNALRWGTERGKHRSMTGMGGAEPDMDDWGFGAIWSSKLAPGLPYQVFALQKNTLEYKRGDRQVPWTQRETFGAKLVPNCPFVLHASLAIVAGTVVIFLVGFLMGRLFGRAGRSWALTMRAACFRSIRRRRSTM